MLMSFFGISLAQLIFFALHVTNSGSFPRPLSAKEEQECLERFKNGDLEARQTLIEHNLRLVAHIVKKYYTSNCDQDDLISIGTIGLIKGISTFDNTKNIRLATYASRCVENEILMSFRNLKKSSQDVYISDPIDMDKEGNTLTLQDIIAEEDTIVEDIDTKIKVEHLSSFLDNTLDEREKSIILQRYGIGGQKEKTQNEIAKEMDISRSYVSRIEKKALEKLKKRFDTVDGRNSLSHRRPG